MYKTKSDGSIGVTRLSKYAQFIMQNTFFIFSVGVKRNICIIYILSKRYISILIQNVLLKIVLIFFFKENYI